MNTDDEFKEFSGLAGRLKRADFSGESRVKDLLKTSLLEKAERRRRGNPFMWLVPAAALGAALFMVINVRHSKPQPAPGNPGASYALPSDGYGECGRQGLGDYMSEGRF